MNPLPHPPPGPQPSSRRAFVRDASLALAALAVGAPALRAADRAGRGVPPDPFFRELCMFALDAARTAGASYADVRAVRRRDQAVRAGNREVGAVTDEESVGIGVRVLVAGVWGFAATPLLTRDDAVAAARAAVGDAAGRPRIRPVQLAPVAAYPGNTWQSPIAIDPFAVSLEEKQVLLVRANAAALDVPGVDGVTSSLVFTRLETTFASTAGSILEQTVYRSWPRMTVTALAPDGSHAQSRTSAEVPAMGLGYEHVQAADLVGRAAAWAEDAVRKVTAPPVTPGTYDVILDPGNLAAAIRETIAYPTQLARALGSDAGPAATSFLTPPSQLLGTFRYGPDFMNVQADRTQAGGLATVGWDDEGVPGDSWSLVRDGVLVDYQTTRDQAPLIAEWTGITHSHGCAHAESWDRPAVSHLPNVSLLPGEEDYTLEDLIGATERGLLLVGSGSSEIDQRQYAFRFGCQMCYEIRDGRLGAVLRDAAYMGRSDRLWHGMDLIGGSASYRLGGAVVDAAGPSAPADASSHGSPPARFRGVEVVHAAPGA